jgi:predicted XRE-type DNA-binding protein
VTFPARRPNALAELIMRRIQEENLSLGDAAKRGGIPKPTLVALARGDLRQAPKPETQQGVARAIAVPVSMVQERIAEALGISRQDSDDELIRDVNAWLAEMSEEDRRMGHALIATLYRTKTQAG